MELLEKTVLNIVDCGGQCYGMSDQEFKFWTTYSVIFCNLPLSPGEIQTCQATEHSTIQGHIYINPPRVCGGIFVPHQSISSSSIPP